MNLYMRAFALLLIVGCFGLRADANGVGDLQAQIVAQMQTCDGLVAQKNTAQAELMRRQKNGAPADQINQVQLSVDALSKQLVGAQQKLTDLQNKMQLLQSQPKT